MMQQQKHKFTFRRAATHGCELLDGDGNVIAWAADEAWAAGIAASWNEQREAAAGSEPNRETCVTQERNMNADELKLKLDAYFGMNGTMTPDHEDYKIEYCSPTGISLLIVGISIRNGQWEARNAWHSCLGDDFERATGSGDQLAAYEG